jgi:hypothetical protein
LSKNLREKRAGAGLTGHGRGAAGGGGQGRRRERRGAGDARSKEHLTQHFRFTDEERCHKVSFCTTSKKMSFHELYTKKS